jgi:glycosyltransferase involved in cell wall biosynthesis
MGYSDYFLSKYFAKAGHELHFIAGNIQLTYDNYDDIYLQHLGPNKTQCGTRKLENFTLHILPVFRFRRKYVLRGVMKEIKKISPDIVLANETVCPTTFIIVFNMLLKKQKFVLFSEDHVHLSVFPPAHKKLGILEKLKFSVYRKTIAKLLNHFIQKCYVIAPDTAEIMVNYFGIDQKKMSLIPLASDTDWFHPAVSDEELKERNEIRDRFGVSEKDILCIYTGRFSEDKNPLCLAKAVDILNQKGEAFKALFVGAGSEDMKKAITDCKGCFIQDFVLAKDLPPYYRAADVGIWPKQESTSQLDAMASRLPIIVSDRVQTEERTLGNSLTYKENDCEDLAKSLLRLKDEKLRQKLGSTGVEKIEKHFNWNDIVNTRLKDAVTALENK